MSVTKQKTSRKNATSGTAKKPEPATRDQVLEVIQASGGFMGFAEVADALGVRGQNLQFIKDLPEPVQSIRASRLWLASEIQEFAKVYRARQKPVRQATVIRAARVKNKAKAAA